MKICTMTCHHVYNYGASLQAYALQHYLESLGHDVEIIDYRLPSHRRYDWSYIYPEGRLYNLTQKFPFLKWPVGLYRNRRMFATWGRKQSFDLFDANYLNITECTYRTTEDLQHNPPNADLYIAGSDQIWNTDAPNGHMPGYYLDFGLKSTKRISYAASFGIAEIADECKEFVKEKVRKLNAISVREKSGAKILGELEFSKVDVVCDPVFLLSKAEWKNLARQSKSYNLKKDSYILLYDFIGDEHVEEFCKQISKETGKKIVSVNDFESRQYADMNINNAGPLEFVSLIDNAAYVIANSFHATAFSVILEKDFYTFSLKTQRNSSRMTDFMNIVGLQNRFHTIKMQPEINYTLVMHKLNEYIESGKKFLERNLKR